MSKKPNPKSSQVRLGNIDPSALKITDEPYQGRRPGAESKYAAVFAAVGQGQRIVCPAGHAGKLAQQLRIWLRGRGQAEPLVRSQEDYGDGMGGVWWLGAKEPKTTKAPNAPWPTMAAVGGKRKAA